MKLKPRRRENEVDVINVNGITDFDALQNAFVNSCTQKMFLSLFDVPFCDAE